MGLNKKLQKTRNLRNHSDYEKSLINQYNSKIKKGEVLEKSRIRRPTLASQIAMSESGRKLEILLRVQNRLNDRESRLAYRYLSATEVIGSNSNYFLTLSMNPCHDNKWFSYQRDSITHKLYRSTLVLIKKMYLEFDTSLKDKKFEDWPFFIAVMEHFDDKGNLVAPHMHIIFKIDVEIQILKDFIENFWKNAVPEAGASGINLQYLDSYGLPDRARYIFKHAYQDEEFKLENGAMPELVAARYGWSKNAVSHDIWMIRRENFRAALAYKSVAYV